MGCILNFNVISIIINTETYVELNSWNLLLNTEYFLEYCSEVAQ